MKRVFFVRIIGLEVLKLNAPQRNIWKSNPQGSLKFKFGAKNFFSWQNAIKAFGKGKFLVLFKKLVFGERVEEGEAWDF